MKENDNKKDKLLNNENPTNNINYLDNFQTKLLRLFNNNKIVYILIFSLIIIFIIGLLLIKSTSINPLSNNANQNLNINSSNVDLVGTSETYIDGIKDEKVEIIKNYDYSDSVKKGYVINQDIEEKDGIKKITVTISKGKEIKEEDKIIMPDFTSYTKDKIDEWAKTNSIEINYSYEKTSGVANRVLNQQPEKDSEILKGDTIKITLSAKKTLYVPNVIGKNITEAAQIFKDENIKYSIKYEYNTKNKKDFIISTSPAANKVLNQNGTVSVYVSLGLPIISDFTNKSLTKFKEEIDKINNSGASIRYTTTEEYSDDVNYGFIISQDVKGEVSLSKTIKLVISKGEDRRNVNFAGKSLDYTTEWLSSRVYNVDYIAVYSTDIEKNIVISSNPLNLETNDNVTITYSLGKYEVPNLLGMTKDEIDAVLKAAKNKGADISYSFINVNNGSFEKGQCCYYEVEDKLIIISLSKGNMITVADYSGKSLSEFQNAGICSSLACNFILDGYTDELQSGETIITYNQSGDFTYGETIDVNYLKGE